MKSLGRLALSSVVILALSCATSSNIQLEEARFALDNGDSTKAIASAEALLASNPADVEAALLLSAAYAGRAGVDILNIADDIANGDSTNDLFNIIHNALANNIQNLNDLRTSIVTLGTTLATQPESTHELFAEHQFQLGILETIEAFALSALSAKTKSESTPTVSRITDAMQATSETDFIRADNHLINGKIKADNTLVTNIRRNYCVLQNASAAGTQGFSTAALRDINLCQLTPSAQRAGLGGFEAVTACTDLNFNACNNAGDTQ